jgi:uncharacterized membrane protein YfcA
MELLIVSLASLLAGLIDSIVGGGGLILLPALFATFPGAAPATLFGTNKSASIWGTAFATVQYSRKVVMPWRSLIPAAGAGLVGSLVGAWVVTHVDPTLFRKALPIMLTVLLVYTVAKKDLGRSHAPRFIGRQEAWMAAGIGLVIGFYDGFFGPGTGSFLVFAYVRLMGYDFLNASASAKLINVATNFSALVLFAVQRLGNGEGAHTAAAVAMGMRQWGTRAMQTMQEVAVVGPPVHLTRNGRATAFRLLATVIRCATVRPRSIDPPTLRVHSDRSETASEGAGAG